MTPYENNLRLWAYTWAAVVIIGALVGAFWAVATILGWGA